MQVRIYIQVRTAIFFSFSISIQNTDYHAIIAARRAFDCGANGPRFEPSPLPPLFGQALEKLSNL